jgi:hypothetical protein
VEKKNMLTFKLQRSRFFGIVVIVVVVVIAAKSLLCVYLLMLLLLISEKKESQLCIKELFPVWYEITTTTIK